MTVVTLAAVLLGTGLLAGIEAAVRVGVAPAIASLDDRAHLAVRVALVRRLKVVVPIVMGWSVVWTVLLLLLGVPIGGPAGPTWFCSAGVGAAGLLAFLLIAFIGTVPINVRVNDWDPDEPPADWRRVVARWQRIDTARCIAAVVSLAGFAVGAAALAT